jgi:hypothetical protein
MFFFISVLATAIVKELMFMEQAGHGKKMQQSGEAAYVSG